jgi:hypothetical protein
MPKNARPTSRPVHAVLGALTERQPRELERDHTANLKKLLHMLQSFATDKKHNLSKPRICRDRLKLKNEFASQTDLTNQPEANLAKPLRIRRTSATDDRKKSQTRLYHQNCFYW